MSEALPLPIHHLPHLKHVFETIYKIGFRLNLDKCEILQDNVNYLGYEVRDGKVLIPEKQKMKAMMWREPSTKKELRGFIGFTGYFSQFIDNYADIMIPLYECTRGKKTDKFIFTEYARKAFTTMRDAIHTYKPRI